MGAQRAGTTWLHNCLKEHAGLSLPEKKEVHYFDRNYDKGSDWYYSHFKECEGRLLGEITPNYYHAPNALERIARDLDDVKIIYILRDPLSRAYSQYQLYSQSTYSGRTFDDVINNEASVVDFSLQGKYLKKIFSLFKKQNVLVLFYDDIEVQPEATIKKVFEFLCVESDFIPVRVSQRSNRVVLPGMQKLLSQMGLKFVTEWVKKSFISEFVKEFFYKKPRSNISNVPNKEILGEFNEDVNVIEKLMNKDLLNWKKKLNYED